jgi:hypothetical protein
MISSNAQIKNSELRIQFTAGQDCQPQPVAHSFGNAPLDPSEINYTSARVLAIPVLLINCAALTGQFLH